MFCGIHSEAPSLKTNWQEGPKQPMLSYFMEELHVHLLLNSEVQMSRNESISSYLNMVKYGNSAQSRCLFAVVTVIRAGALPISGFQPLLII